MEIESIISQAVALTTLVIGQSNTPPQTAEAVVLCFQKMHGAVMAAATGAVIGGQEPKAELVPAVPIKKSVTPQYIICLDNGRKLKTLKRHLQSLGMSPEQYRAKWGLPRDYPMVAPAYASHRSDLAKAAGLGRGGIGGGKRR